MPARIVIVRHAEKPALSSDPNLSLAGYARALLLARYLERNYSPDFIFAAKSTNESRRPELTMLPTAAHIGELINLEFSDAKYKHLAKHLSKRKFAGAAVLICWHHGHIPQLIRALGCTWEEPPIPENVFNRIWEIGQSTFYAYDLPF